MPRTRLDPKPHPLAVLIWGVLKAGGQTPESIRGSGITSGTLRRRLASPDDFTVGELRLLSRVLHIPAEEIRACIKF